MRRGRHRMAAWGLGVCLCAGGAWANSFETEYPDNSARALGRGGAFAVRADDASAIYYNPAGLTRQPGFGVMLSMNLVGLNHGFEPDDEHATRTAVRSMGAVTQKGGLSPAPMLAATYRFEALPELAIGVGVYGPPGKLARNYDELIKIKSIGTETVLQDDRIKWLKPNGYLVESELMLLMPTVSVAYQVLPQLSLGASFHVAMMNATISKGISAPEPALTTLEMSDWFTPAFTLGAHYAPVKWLELGATVRPGFTIDARGKAKLERYQFHGSEAGFKHDGGLIELQNKDGSPNDALSFEYNHPLVVRGGVRVVQRRFDVEFNYIYQRLRTHEAFSIDLDATQASVDGLIVPVPKIRDERFYQDTHEFRLGGDYVVLPRLLSLRAGATWSNGASPDSHVTLDFPALDRWSAHGGATVQLPGDFAIDVGYAYVGLVDREVSESEAGYIDITRPKGVGSAVANGRFYGNYHIFGLGVSWQYGAEGAREEKIVRPKREAQSPSEADAP